SRCRSQLPLVPDRDSTLRPNAEPRDTRPVRPLEIKRHEWSKISPCGPQADDDDGFVLGCRRFAEALDERDHIVVCKVLPAKRLGQTHPPFQQPFWQRKRTSRGRSGISTFTLSNGNRWRFPR